jgi:hypothetical protein
MSTDSEEEAKSDSSSDEENHRHQSHHHSHTHIDHNSNHHHHHNHYQHHNHSHLSSRLYESDNPDDTLNRERDNESKISTQRSRVSKNTLINHEHLKSNRLSTLVGAVSTNNLASNSSTMSTSEKLKKSSKADEKTNDLLNNVNKSNSNDAEPTSNLNAMNLLKQIKHHQSARKLNSSASNKVFSSMSINKEATESNGANATNQEEISENNLSKLTIAVLKLLNQLEIKFPGKNNDQTKALTSAIYSKLEAYKPKLANYWMIKLDDSKRSKVIYIELFISFTIHILYVF